MTYELTEVARQLRQDPAETISRYEQEYRKQIEAVAEKVLAGRQKSPVVLLAGPSGSSKTTTGSRLRDHLLSLGVPTHLISMDNYYLSWDTPDFPRTPEGERDLESPLCLDIPLLNEHFARLEAGEAIHVPIYDFPSHSRLEGRSIRMSAGEVFIFEGIHALNPQFTERHPDAFRLFVSPTASFSLEGQEVCSPQILRLMRRVVRDYQFRGASAEFSLQLWGNVVASEKVYIEPYRAGANGEISTTLGYELGILKPFVEPLLQVLPTDVPCRNQVDAALEVFHLVEGLSETLVPKDSILREFIG
jgi:uridine kinase